MPKPLRVLFVEDSASDTEEMLNILRRSGFTPSWQRVESAAQLQEQLSAYARWDLIIVDQCMPGFYGTEALVIVRRSKLKIPLIVVSGVFDDEIVVAAMRAGANDFFCKSRLSRLGAAIDRELAERLHRQEREADLETLQAEHDFANYQLQVRHELQVEKIKVDVDRKNLRSLFNATSTLVAIVAGPLHLLEFSNPAHIQLLGGEFSGQPLGQLRPEDRELLAMLDQVYASGATARSKQIALPLDQEPHFFDIVMVARRDGDDEVNGVMIMGSDVTEQLRAQRAAEASSAAKSAFLANMSHEIRTPLTAILGFTALLKEHDLTQLEHERYIDTVHRNGQALTRIIDDILDLAKIEAGRLDVEAINCSLQEIAADVVALFYEAAREKNIELQVMLAGDLPAKISSDPTRLRQVLFNIVGNAIKFTNKGGVCIKIKIVRREGDKLYLRIDVKDTGCGLTLSQRKRLFKPFTQADNTTTRRFGGTGLGLALSKRLCEALGGTISIARSEPGAGSTFVITFVATVGEAAAKVDSYDLNFVKKDPYLLRLQDIRVLVADDALDNQFLVKKLLTRSGARVDLASNGIEALEKALNGPHDLILMDIQMPEMDGYQALALLRKNGYTKPVIALTAHALFEERVRTSAAGFVGHLTKPIDQLALIELVAQKVGRLQLAPSVGQEH